MAEAIMLDLDSENLRKLLTEPWTPEWQGTCELCGNGGLHLQHVAGCLLCRTCHKTITKNLKETAHPFTDARVRMEPTLRGTGKPGDVQPLPPVELRQALVREFVRDESAFRKFLSERMPELLREMETKTLSPGTSTPS